MSGPSGSRAEQLAALGYITSNEIRDEDLHKDGVTLYRRDKSAPGVNVYCSEDSDTLKLVGMDGELLHSVAVSNPNVRMRSNQCKTAAFDSAGNFVMVLENTALVKSDLDGRELWRRNGRYHHDVDVLDDGTTFALRQQLHIRDNAFSADGEIIDNRIVRVSAEGEILEEISLAKMVRDVPALLEKAKRHIAEPRYTSELREEFLRRDVFHTNSIRVLRSDVRVGPDTVFKAGWILLCVRHLDSVMVVDPAQARIVWHWGAPELQWPHNASFRSDGTLLVFDNGVGRQHSRVLSVSPATGQIVGAYKGAPPSSFFSRTRGSIQMLENGNRLICESEKGRVFELDSSDEVVWEYWNPDRDRTQKKRSTIFEFNRISVESHPFLRRFVK